MLTEIDFTILDFIQENMRSGIGDILMKGISLLGNHGILFIATALCLLLLKKTRKAGFMLAIALTAGLVICNVVLKNAVGRIRPFDIVSFPLLISPPTDFSFPSGHTLHSFICASVIHCSLSRRWGIAAYVFSAIMGFSRMYLYVHYPSDVLAGALLGIAIGRCSVRLCNKYLLKKLR